MTPNYAVDTQDAVSVGLADAWSRYLSSDADFRGNRENEGNGPGQGAGQNERDKETGETRETSQQDPVSPVSPAGEPAPTALTSGVSPVSLVSPETGSRTDTPPGADCCPDCAEPYDSIDHQINCEGLDAPEGTTP
jgi:hypothetical protein